MTVEEIKQRAAEIMARRLPRAGEGYSEREATARLSVLKLFETGCKNA